MCFHETKTARKHSASAEAAAAAADTLMEWQWVPQLQEEMQPVRQTLKQTSKKEIIYGMPLFQIEHVG
jgi:hypothetical protein